MRDARERFAAVVIARDTVREVATLLAGRNIPVMPLKGVLLQRLVYDDPAERMVSDVDVLVPDDAFDGARSRLRAAGYRPRLPSPSFIEESFFAPSGMVLDLHRCLFGRGRYRMPTDQVLRRARTDTELFGAPVLLPDPLDLYAHLVGKVASDRAVPGDSGRFEDLARVARRFDLDATSTARHLDACGMGRAARYALPWLAELTGDAFPGRVIDRLRPDPVGAALAAGARAVIPRLSIRSPLRAIPAHLLNHSLFATGGAASIAAFNRIRYRSAMRRLDRTK